MTSLLKLTLSRALFKVPFSEYIQGTVNSSWVIGLGLFLIKFSLETILNSIARTNLFGDFAESLRPVILKSTESSHEPVHFQKQSPGENVFLKITQNLLGNTCGGVFFSKVRHRCFPVNLRNF